MALRYVAYTFTFIGTVCLLYVLVGVLLIGFVGIFNMLLVCGCLLCFVLLLCL